jgi:hypothetical protein
MMSPARYCFGRMYFSSQSTFMSVAIAVSMSRIRLIIWCSRHALSGSSSALSTKVG